MMETSTPFPALRRFSVPMRILLLRKSPCAGPYRRAGPPRLRQAEVKPGSMDVLRALLCRVSLWRQAHPVTETLQALDQIVPQPLRLPLVEVVHSQIPIFDVILQHVIEDHQQAVPHGDQRPLLAPSRRQPAVLGAEVAVLGPPRRPRRLGDRPPQPAVLPRRPAPQPLARRLLVPGTDPRPGAEVVLIREDRHVRPD